MQYGIKVTRTGQWMQGDNGTILFNDPEAAKEWIEIVYPRLAVEVKEYPPVIATGDLNLVYVQMQEGHNTWLTGWVSDYGPMNVTKKLLPQWGVQSQRIAITAERARVHLREHPTELVT